MPRNVQTLATVLLACLGCHRGAKTEATPPDTADRPLAAYVSQRIIVTPTAHVRAADSLGWVQQLGVRGVGRQLDSSIAATLETRGIGAHWILPAELVRSYERNRSYAADPYQLAVEEVRSPRYAAGKKYGEPLSTQLRTMIALHEDARLVLLPVDLRFERAMGAGQAILRVILVDPRFAESRWIADVKSDPARSPAEALASVAAHLANLFAAP